MHTMLIRILTLLSITAVANIYSGQIAEAKPIKRFESTSEFTEKSKHQTASTLLAQTNVSIDDAPNYLGIGGSLGLIEDEFGDFGAFAVTGKLRLFPIIDSREGGTDLSLRPSMIVGEDVSFAIPVTLDLRLPPFQNTDTDAVVPYFGPGVLITTGDNSAFKFLMAAGLDVPIGAFTTNAQLNVGFLDETALGLTLSVGYNF